MGDPITFNMREHQMGPGPSGMAYYIVEDSTPPRDAMSFHDFGQVRDPSAKERAAAALAFMQAEHAEGRVAQGRCSIGSTRDDRGVRQGGTPCDFDRIVDARRLSDAQRAAIVLCDTHADDVDAAMLAGREAGTVAA